MSLLGSISLPTADCRLFAEVRVLWCVRTSLAGGRMFWYTLVEVIHTQEGKAA